MAPAEAPLSSLLAGILHDAEELVKDHAELARTELDQSLTAARRVAILGLLGSQIAMMALLLLLVAASLGIGAALHHLWLGFIIVGVLTAVVAAVALLVALQQRRAAKPHLRATTQAIREDVRWASTTLKSLS